MSRDEYEDVKRRKMCSLMDEFGDDVRHSRDTDLTAARSSVTNLGTGIFILDKVRQKQMYVNVPCMIDYYVRSKTDDEKAVEEKKVQMIVRGDSGVSKTCQRSAPGVLIVASLLGRANGEQFTLVVEVDQSLIIAVLVAVVVVLIMVMVSAESVKLLTRRCAPSAPRE